MTLPASVRGFNLKNHEESQLIEKWHRFFLGGGGKSPPPGTYRVKVGLTCNFKLDEVMDILLRLTPISNFKGEGGSPFFVTTLSTLI